jgi:hypothetical protein
MEKRARRPVCLLAGERRTRDIAEGMPVLVVVWRIVTGPQSDRHPVQPVEAATIIISTDSAALDDTI